jgi:membrane protease YdiL (CAAX protease family)
VVRPEVSPGARPATARWRRDLATLVPAVMPLAMKAVFTACTRRYGAERGYQAGFAIYWATCWTSAGVIVGPRRLLDLWRRPAQLLPTPGPVAAVSLALPPLGALATEWLPNARAAGPAAVAVAAALGITNALAEEALWRGVPVVTFPDDPLRGWLWPAAGFTAWHLVPLSTRPTTPSRRTALLGGSAAIGLGYGWIAYRTHSLATVTSAHALTDACGVRAARTIWLVRDP